MRTAEVNSIYEYLENVSALAEGGIELWYRGSSNIDFGLLPGLIWRKETQWEHNFVHKFLVRYKAYTNESIDSPWELFALMQHHGLPTRLLDWTRSPLIALYFSLTKEPHVDRDRVVWVLPPHDLNKESLGTASVFCPGALKSRKIELSGGKTINLDSYLPEALDANDHNCLPGKAIAIESPLSGSRISAQQGCFTLHGSDSSGIEEQFTQDSPPYLAAFTIKTKGNVNSFLEPLLSWGINEESIFQDLDSMVSNIKRLEGL